ncbi:ribosome-associated ATPase/putative transporter RbbA [Celeribacter sp. PS-C1]|uniref:ribosome-associated ATPase/putative transporter RbbA n=1 Tax=Celeribacter sp. PS-C1 TaxID=2820813 RepID=UPI001CA59668|nr:ribosome-associated ATPase/putative transporter RbbA [Celeribacter sp. PS-C1]MBW6419741.1 ribosome-associated ATPase/putative transporter RbbA [Celeribacter sp. PS-C1]
MGYVARLNAVSHRYKAVFALDDVTLDIPAGKVVGLIGPDGVGKSTLLGLIAGVRKAQAGEVTVLGQDMRDASARSTLGARIAYMPQGLGKNLYPTLSVRENLDFFGRLFGQQQAERRKRIAMLTEATGLAPFLDRPAGKLSGGMKQKLGLCAALIHDPDLLILDEPTTGVDPLSRRQFWELIDRIRAKLTGMSVLVATAYMEEAERFEWLAAMNDGKVIAIGSPEDIRAQAGKATLEDAFIEMLPKEEGEEVGVTLRTRPAKDGTVPAIEAFDLVKRFGDFTAVDHVSFTIPEGEIFGFLGSNGCGKSTTMKMLTGLLQPTEGRSKLFGEELENGDMAARQNIGYMSQAFSLYTELTVRQNLELHAELYHIPPERRAERVREVLDEFELTEVAASMPDGLPLGIRQRLQLAVATIHEPRILILDEPTSGVDPLARDAFWRKLISLSRDEGVTIFISTHFMNEAERCDRISLMHAGRVLDVGTPEELTERRGAQTLEEAFIAALEGETQADEGAADTDALRNEVAAVAPNALQRAVSRLWAYTSRETLELIRDPIRMFFALAGPIILLITMGFGISFDVDKLSFAVNDMDHTPESRRLIEAFSSIPQFDQKDDFTSLDALDRQMERGNLTVALEIPDGFGKALHQGSAPEISLWIDGSMPFRGETAEGYALGLLTQFADDLATETGTESSDSLSITTRYLYNQAFKSAHAMVPSMLMLILMLIPAIMSAISVVREKETGTIANFRATPVRKVEFLIGKQIPYIIIAWFNFWVMAGLGLWVFGVPLHGSLPALGLAALFYVIATTGFGQFMSSFTRTQVSAVFATAVLSIIPTVNFSGLITPVSTLAPMGRIVGLSFPGAWFQPISIGTFLKGFGFGDVAINILVITGFCLIYLTLSVLALRKQEA